MERRNISRTIKSIMLISALLMMLLLCGCRTRVTNNTDVTSTITDESGTLQQMYQDRRDELGSPIAESPLIKGMGSGEEDLDYEEFGDPFANSDTFTEEDDEEDYEEEDTSTDRRTSDDEDGEEGEGGASTRTSTQKRGSSSSSHSSSSSTNTSNGVKVTLNVNGSGAKCSASSVKVKKGSTYGDLPTPTWEGHSFEGWYTKKTNGDKVTSKTKVTNGNAHTLYAHWKKSGSGNSEQKPDPTPETKTPHKVSFNINGAEGVDTPADITIEEGGTYPALPTLTRTGYKFLGWETEDGTQITEGAPYNATTDQTLKAIWKSNHDWWNEDFETAANDVKADERFIVTVDDGDSSEKGLVEDCKGQLSKDGDVPNYVVVFIKNYSESSAKDKAESVYDKYKEFAPSVKVIVVSDQALKGNDNEKLLYKMMLFDAMYGEGKDHFDDQRTDLDAEGDYPYIYPKND